RARRLRRRLGAPVALLRLGRLVGLAAPLGLAAFPALLAGLGPGRLLALGLGALLFLGLRHRYLSLPIISPLRRATRTFLPSVRSLCPTRVGLPVPGSITMTFEASMGPSFSMIPPWIPFVGFGRVCRLIMLTCSTMTLP